jgi:hypothetical protein
MARKMGLQKRFGLNPQENKSGLGCGKEDGCSLSPTVEGSGVGHGKGVLLILLPNRSILLCFLPVYLHK